MQLIGNLTLLLPNLHYLKRVPEFTHSGDYLNESKLYIQRHRNIAACVAISTHLVYLYLILQTENYDGENPSIRKSLFPLFSAENHLKHISSSRELPVVNLPMMPSSDGHDRLALQKALHASQNRGRDWPVDKMADVQPQKHPLKSLRKFLQLPTSFSHSTPSEVRFQPLPNQPVKSSHSEGRTHAAGQTPNSNTQQDSQAKPRSTFQLPGQMEPIWHVLPSGRTGIDGTMNPERMISKSSQNGHSLHLTRTARSRMPNLNDLKETAL
ncbi:cyclin-dependent kinase-like 5 [Rhincodon typus]|uniref:cyclin-dependent kinase-like 5 n=1 Tax=Rhincodon typus TaxID=259920 RepID=UPI002030FCB2|nr:cyclin-dependent kinase-like 5 [Rhincodon typus]